MEKETEPKRPDFVRLYLDDLREDTFHLNDEARMSNDKGITKPKNFFVIRTNELFPSFVI